MACGKPCDCLETSFSIWGKHVREVVATCVPKGVRIKFLVKSVFCKHPDIFPQHSSRNYPHENQMFCKHSWHLPPVQVPKLPTQIVFAEIVCVFFCFCCVVFVSVFFELSRMFSFRMLMRHSKDDFCKIRLHVPRIFSVIHIEVRRDHPEPWNQCFEKGEVYPNP